MKIALHGYGKMGRTVERLARESGHEVVAVLSRGHDGNVNGAETLIDFSTATGVEAAVSLACEHALSLIIGTTGWHDRMENVKRRIEAGGIGCVWASNFSPGANVMFALARRAGELLAHFPQYAAGIEERHHSKKKDAPSGTAIRIAEEVVRGSEGAISPPISASRVGSEFGLHTLFFDAPDDLIELSHRARNRDGFARGAIVAAEMIQGKTGMVRFDELLVK